MENVVTFNVIITLNKAILIYKVVEHLIQTLKCDKKSCHLFSFIRSEIQIGQLKCFNMGYICDTAHQHDLEIQERQRYLSTQDSTHNDETEENPYGSQELVCDKNEDIIRQVGMENRSYEEDHLINYVLKNDDTTDNKINNTYHIKNTVKTNAALDLNYQKYRKFKCYQTLDIVIGYHQVFVHPLFKPVEIILISASTNNNNSTFFLNKYQIRMNKTPILKLNAVNNISSDFVTSNKQSYKDTANARYTPTASTDNVLTSASSLGTNTTTTKRVTSNNYTASNVSSIKEKRKCSSIAKFKPLSSSHHNDICGFVKNSFCLYLVSTIIIFFCYLTTPIVAYETVHPIFAEGKSDKEILDHLLKNTRYDKRLLPPVDDADFCCGMNTPEMANNETNSRQPGKPQNRGTLTVNVSVLLLSLASPDESSLKYEVEFLLQQQWYDPRLRYANQSQYEYLNAIHHHEDIWLPDTYFIMHGDFKDPIIPMHFALRIYRNGTINYLMRRHLILSCQGRLNIFPFDDPLCSFALESISYEQSAITYVWKNDEDTLRKSPSLTTLNAYLIQNQTIACPIKASWRGNYSCLKVDLKFTRDRAFYFTTVFIPGIILVTSSFITFWLEWNAVPARVMIGVTTMLNFFTTSNGFRSTLPVVSNLTAMNVWDGVCMCFIYASLLEFVCVNYVGRKRPLHNVVYRPGENPVTQRLPAVLSRIGVILASPLEVIEQEFHAAISAEKPSVAVQPTPILPPQPASQKSSSAFPRSTTTDDAEIGGIDSRKSVVKTKVLGELNEVEILETCFGPGETSKKRESSGPNEIVACTSCGGTNSPCTHSANNGCATETCFVQVRKKEPPHPIRVAKTIDVIARITFPTAYAVFLIFFFIHYKGFS
uniref:CSON004372 protein n=1 Tax=Culicoides sonorensis TaxID=179676 RepID=A0A336LYA0_CULSO